MIGRVFQGTMQMRHTLGAGFLAAALLLPICAQADFVVSGAIAAPATSVAAPQILQPGQHVGDAASTDTETTHGPVRPRFSVANGFGDGVPLRFAVRQIVPKSVRVVYGPGTSADALVTWKGGQGWNWVLFRAVRPLGLRLIISHMAVEIRK